MKRFLPFAALALGIWACGDDEKPAGVTPSDSGRPSVPGGGTTSNGGSAGEGAAQTEGGTGAEPTPEGGRGGEGGEAVVPVPTEGPEVTITQPDAVDDPATGTILTQPEVTVLCQAQARQGGAPVDPSSVKIQLLGATDSPIGTAAAANPTGEPDQYSAEFILSNVPSGRVGFRCTANDTQTSPKSGTDLVETFFDAGPVITPDDPAPESSQSANAVIPIRFEVEPAELSDNDPGSEVTEVAFFVKDIEIPMTATGTTYTGSLNLQDKQLFPVTPSGTLQVEIEATNRRGVQRRQLYAITVDNTGPVVTIEQPALRQLVGGVQPLVFTVKDDSGVAPESVVVIIDGQEYRFDALSPLWKPEGDRITFFYDWGQVGTEISQVNVNIRASDTAGNESDITSGGTLYYVDNVAPYIDLDPRNVREVRETGPDKIECSQPFDPVGENAVNDLDEVAPHILVRALVYDRTNEVAGQYPFYNSQTKPESVRLYLQPNPDDGPLLTNRRGDDNLCDDILEPSTLPFTALRFVPPEGAMPGPTESDPYDPSDLPVVPQHRCVAGATDSSSGRCSGGSEMRRVIAHETQGANVPVVYAVGTEQDDRANLACAGVTWQIWPTLTKNREGWVCLAVVAEDGVGNRDVSAPLRLCVSDGKAPEPNCDGEPPSCTDGCNPQRANVPEEFVTGLLDVN